MTPRPDGTADAPIVVRAEERLRTTTQRVAVERVRIAKRVVTETRTFTVKVRREELVVERLPAGADPDQPADGDRADLDQATPLFELILHEEVPEVTIRVVPVERVRVTKTAHRTSSTEQATVRREVIDVIDDRTQP